MTTLLDVAAANGRPAHAGRQFEFLLDSADPYNGVCRGSGGS